MISEIEGNLLTAKEDYIVQQCCCTACKPHGLSEAIAKVFPYGNPYAKRKPIAPGKNTARIEDQAVPGSVEILGNIVCLYGQMAMGKPGKYNSFNIPDSAQDRERYFEESLENLTELIPEVCSLAFPFKIGCGLAGGYWPRYKKILETWSEKHPGYRILIYKL